MSGGADEIDGDKLDIDFVPSSYTRDTTPTEVTLVAELTAHLKGIDNALGAGVTTFLGHSDTPTAYTGAAGQFVKVNATPNALEFAALAAGDLPSHTHVEADITDLQAYLLNINAESIDDLSDVAITAAANGDFLRFNGTSWVDAVITESDISDLSHEIIIQEEGSTVTGGPHATINFVGASVTAGDAGSGVAVVTISGDALVHDEQEANSSVTASTQSLSFVDVPGMTLTTNNGQNLDYLIIFNATGACSKSDELVICEIQVGGVTLTNSERTLMAETDEAGGGRYSFTLVALAENVANGTVIRLRFKSSLPDNEAVLLTRTLDIRGIG